MVLTAFGRLLEHLLRQHGITKQDLARKTGITSTSVMSEVVRSKDAYQKAYSPREEWLPLWADELGLTGQEREWFIFLGLISRCGSTAEQTAIKLASEAAWPVDLDLLDDP